MGLNTARSALLVALVACATPNVTVDVDRTQASSMTMTMTLCPIDAPTSALKCRPPDTVFSSLSGALTYHQNIFIENDATAFTIYFDPDGAPSCQKVDIELGASVAVTYTLPDAPMCKPAASCTISSASCL
jgi:hypothetical protein